MPPFRCNYIRRGRPLGHAGCRGKRSWRRRPSPAMPAYRTCLRAAVLPGRACVVHAAARLRRVSVGDVEAEPEQRPLLLTVRRYNTVQDGAATRLAAPSRWRSTRVSSRSASPLAFTCVPASPPPPAIGAHACQADAPAPPDCILDYLLPCRPLAQ